MALRWESRFPSEMMQSVDFLPGERILDLRCATGSSFLVIREKAGEGATLVGADLAIGQLRQATRKAGFQEARRISKFHGTMQVVVARVASPDGTSEPPIRRNPQ